MSERSMVMDIISILEKDLGKSLPKFGVIAGQSVAEAYFRVNKLQIKTRIKDVDLFSKNYIGLTGFYNKEDKKRKFLIKAFGKKNFLRVNSSFGMVNLIQNGRIDIENVLEKDRLNIIITNENSNYIYSKEHTYLERVVNSFDINSVQIGINLQNKRFYKTEEFDEFTKTKQLKIVNYCSPVPSIARIIDKKEYSENVYLDAELEIKLMIMNILLNEKNNFRGMYTSKERYLSFHEKSREIIEKHFNLEEETTQRDSIELIKFSLNLNVIDKNLITTLKNIKKYFKKDRETEINDRNLLIKLLNKNFHKKLEERVKNNIQSSVMDVLSFKEDLFNEKINDVITVSRHKFFTIPLLKYHSVSKIADFIRRLKREGKTSIIGMFESGLINDNYIIEKNTDEIMEGLEKSKSDHIKKYKHSIDESLLESPFANITQIKTMYELFKFGSSMENCIGGYWNRVEQGFSLIFKIKFDNRYFALELIRQNKRNKEQFKIGQCLGKANTISPIEVEKIAKILCQRINSEFK